MSTTLIGTDASGKIVAEERVSDSRKANQIATGWKKSGLALTTIVVDPAIETGPPKASESVGVQSRVTPSGGVIRVPTASLSKASGPKKRKSQ